MDLDTVMVYRFFSAGAEPTGRLTRIASRPKLDYEMNQAITGFDIDINMNDTTIGMTTPDGTPVRNIRDIVDVNYFVYIDFIQLGAETTILDNQILDVNREPIYDVNNSPLLDTRGPSTVYGQNIKTIFQGYVSKIFTALDGSGVRVSVRSHSQIMADVKTEGLLRAQTTGGEVTLTRQDAVLDFTNPADGSGRLSTAGFIQLVERDAGSPLRLIPVWLVQTFVIRRTFTARTLNVRYRGASDLLDIGTSAGLTVRIWSGEVRNPLATVNDLLVDKQVAFPLSRRTISTNIGTLDFRDYDVDFDIPRELPPGTYTLSIQTHRMPASARVHFAMTTDVEEHNAISGDRFGDRPYVITNHNNPLRMQIRGDAIVRDVEEQVTTLVPLSDQTPVGMAEIILEFVRQASTGYVDYNIDPTGITTDRFNLNLKNVSPLEALKRVAAVAGAYFYCDYGTSTVHFRALPSDVRVLPKDAYSDKGGIERNIEKAVDEALFIGGEQDDGTTLFIRGRKEGGVALRRKVYEIRDNRIVDLGSGRAIVRRFLADNEGVLKSGQIEIIRNKHFDIEDIRPGELISLSGVSNDIDAEELRIFKFTYDGYTLQCQLGYVPPRVQEETTKNKQSIGELGDINIPNIPSA